MTPDNMRLKAERVDIEGMKLGDDWRRLAEWSERIDALTDAINQAETIPPLSGKKGSL